MGTLHIDRKGVELGLENRQLHLREPDGSANKVPLAHLKRIIMHGQGLLDSRLLGALSEQGIALVILNPRNSARTVCLHTRSHKDAARRLAQYQRSLDDEWKARFATIIVTKKIGAQKRLLDNALGQRPDLRHPLFKGSNFLANRLEHLRGRLLNRGTIRGVEGAAALSYFKGFCCLFPDALEFHGRNRRPPRDPVNACLSLGYTLLNAEAVLAIQSAGLDPLIGFYHDIAYGRDSLACDLIEPLRPALDKWIWELFRRRDLRKEHFSTQQGACLLHKAGRKQFYSQWEIFAIGQRRRLSHYVRLLVRSLESGAL